MMVIDLKKQAKNSLVSLTRPHENLKPWKGKHSSDYIVSQHFYTWEWDQKPIMIDFHLQWEEESDFLPCDMLWQYMLDKKFDLTFEEKRSLLSSMTAKISSGRLGCVINILFCYIANILLHNRNIFGYIAFNSMLYAYVI